MAKRKSQSMTNLAHEARRISTATTKMVENDHLPLLWVDSASFQHRSDVPITMIRFFSLVNDKSIEMARIQTSHQHLRALVDTLARVTGHYPTRPDTSTSSAKP